MPQTWIIQAGPDHAIHASFYTAHNRAKAVIVIAHGFKGFKDWGMFPYVAEALRSGYHVVTFNFSHNGIGQDMESFTELEKFAVNTYSREQADLEFVIHDLKDRPDLRELPLFLLGHSRGAGSCFVYGLDHPDQVTGVISWNGVTDLDLFSEEQKQEMREQGRSHVENTRTGQQMPLDVVILEDLERNKEQYAIIERLAASPLQAVLIQGTEDSSRLRKGSARLAAVRPDIEWVQIEGGGHTFNTVHPFAGTTPQLNQAITETHRFMERLLNPSVT